MSEFKFPCPQCRQRIQCDAAYIGAQINCPACGQAVVVPPAPTVVPDSERTIQIKVSTLRMAAMIALVIGLGLLLLAGAFMLTPYLFGPKKVVFRAYVDGTDIVKISGTRLWVEHQDFQLPTRIRINDGKWNPAWNDNTSTPYKLHRAFWAGSPENIKLTKQIGRGDISILQKPAPDNNQTLAIKVDDGAYGGADWYEFTVSW